MTECEVDDSAAERLSLVRENGRYRRGPGKLGIRTLRSDPCDPLCSYRARIGFQSKLALDVIDGEEGVRQLFAFGNGSQG